MNVSCSLGFGFVILIGISTSARADETRVETVHVDASSQVILERIDDAGHASPICRAPCDTTLEAGTEVQITGNGLRASNRLRLPTQGDAKINVHVTPRSSGSFVAGIILTSLSGAFLTGGFAALGWGVAANNSWALLGTSFVAVPLFTTSVALGIPGVILLAENIQSRASVEQADRSLATRPPPLPRATALSVPILTTSF